MVSTVITSNIAVMPLATDVAKLSLTEESKQPIAEPGTELASTEESSKGEETKQEEEEIVDPSELSRSIDRLLFEYCELIDNYQSIRTRVSHLFADVSIAC